MIFKEEIISSQENPNGTKSAVATSRNINFVYGLFVVVGAIIAYSVYAWGETELQMCQQSYMKATNEIQRYNEENPNYQIPLPEYNCNSIITTMSGAETPPPSWKEVSKLETLHKKVCMKQINSPLCKDRQLFDRLYHLTEERLPNAQFFPILVGITNAESSLWLDFAKDNSWGTCFGRNNWGWTKYQIHDDNTRDYSRAINWFHYWALYSWRFVDEYGCNLYPFKDIEEFWITKVNGMRYGYPWCVKSNTPIRCLSYKYVGKPWVAEESWIANVSEFLID